MKSYRYLFCLFALFAMSCQSRTNKGPVSIIEEPQSIIQEWFGTDHFEATPQQTSSSQKENQNDDSSSFTPGGTVFSKEFLDAHPLDTLPQQESFFSHYLFQDGPDLQEELTLDESYEDLH